MSDYTPKTEEVRDGWAFGRINFADGRVRLSECYAEFDRWLAEFEATIRADQIEKDAQVASRTRVEPSLLSTDIWGTAKSVRSRIAARIRTQQGGTE